jgi:serine/threonine protein kinase
MNVQDVKDFHEEYNMGVLLGQGAYAQVRLATKTWCTDIEADAEAVAVKVLVTTGKKAKSKQQSALLEAVCWRSVGQHPNCIELLSVFHNHFSCYLVMEKCTYTLLRYVEQMPETSERSLGSLFLQMLQGISHVHACGMVHRDIKPDNFLVGGEHRETVKLGDFGLAIQLPQSGKLKSVVGTAPFMSPEMLNMKGYDCKADVWSLGVIMYAFLFGSFAYAPSRVSEKEASEAMKDSIRDGSCPPTFRPALAKDKQYSNSFANVHFRTDIVVAFVRRLLSRSLAQRPSAAEALRLDYIREISNDTHALDKCLPSLLPMVAMSARVGAFEGRALCDNQLSKLGLSKIGTAESSLQLKSTGISRMSTADLSMQSKSTGISRMGTADLSLQSKSTGLSRMGTADLSMQSVVDLTKEASPNASDDASTTCPSVESSLVGRMSF